MGLPDREAPETGRRRFEQSRSEARSIWIETIASWLDNWPDAFRAGATAAGLTRRSFLRVRVPELLAREVELLPEGIMRPRTYVPLLDDPVLRRLRRLDPGQYRMLRARRILARLGRAP